MTIKKMIGAAALMGLMASANAASISLVYTGANDTDGTGAVIAAIGDVVTFDVVMDFSGDGERTLGGGFDIAFDTAGLAFESYQVADFGDPFFSRPADLLDGLLESGAFGDFGGLSGPATVASVAFTVVGVGEYDISTSGTMGDGGPFISAIDFTTELDVDYFGARVSSVPVPAAVWFMLSGLGALVGFGRRKAA